MQQSTTQKTGAATTAQATLATATATATTAQPTVAKVKQPRKRKQATPTAQVPLVVGSPVTRDLDAERLAACEQAKQAQAQVIAERTKTAATAANYASASEAWKPAPTAPDAWQPLDMQPVEQSALDSDRKQLERASERITRAGLAQGTSPALGKVAATMVFRLNNPKSFARKQALYKRDCTINGTDYKAGEATRATRESAAKDKGKPALSPDDECEVFQTCALVMAEHGELESERITCWRAIISACRKILRINRTPEISAPIDSPVFELADCIATYPLATRKNILIARQKLARRLQYWLSCIRAELEMSANRKRVFNYRRNRRTIATIAKGRLFLRGMTQPELEQACKLKALLFKSIEAGEAILDQRAAQ